MGQVYNRFNELANIQWRRAYLQEVIVTVGKMDDEHMGREWIRNANMEGMKD